MQRANSVFDAARAAFDNNNYHEAEINFRDASHHYYHLPTDLQNDQTLAVAELCRKRADDMKTLQLATNTSEEAQNARALGNHLIAYEKYQEAGRIYQTVAKNFENKKNNEKINEMAQLCLSLAYKVRSENDLQNDDVINKQADTLCEQAEAALRAGDTKSAQSMFKAAGDLFANYTSNDKRKESEMKMKAPSYYLKATNVKNKSNNTSFISNMFSPSTKQEKTITTKAAESSTSTSKEAKPDWIDWSHGAAKKDVKENKKTNVTNTSNNNIRSTTPVKSSSTKSNSRSTTPNRGTTNTNNNNNKDTHTHGNKDDETNEYEEKLLQEMLDTSLGVSWTDIAGLSFAKQTLQEAVILPNLRPDLFTGLRAPPKGVLLYGPPGTGKTLLAKAVATESGFAFFSVSASSVTSKFVGEGEKLMKGLFSVARKRMPAVIFFDEIDSIMSARKENEHEASRRLKTEFMTQIDGATTSASDRILVMAATNIPWELDEAVLRRMVKRVYVPLPDPEARTALIKNMLKKQNPSSPSVFAFNNKGSSISEDDLMKIVKATDGYSGSDLTAVCQEAGT